MNNFTSQINYQEGAKIHSETTNDRLHQALNSKIKVFPLKLLN